MKFWFSRKEARETPDAGAAARAADDTAPFDATVEQTLRAAQALNAQPSDDPAETPARDIFDIFSTLRAAKPAVDPAPVPETPRTGPASSSPPPSFSPASAASRPARPRTAPIPKPGPKPGSMRAEVERRAANYRAFQLKLNEDREARIRKTMADVRSQLQRIGSHAPPPRS